MNNLQSNDMYILNSHYQDYDEDGNLLDKDTISLIGIYSNENLARHAGLLYYSTHEYSDVKISKIKINTEITDKNRYENEIKVFIDDEVKKIYQEKRKILDDKLTNIAIRIIREQRIISNNKLDDIATSIEKEYQKNISKFRNI